MKGHRKKFAETTKMKKIRFLGGGVLTGHRKPGFMYIDIDHLEKPEAHFTISISLGLEEGGGGVRAETNLLRFADFCKLCDGP